MVRHPACFIMERKQAVSSGLDLPAYEAFRYGLENVWVGILEFGLQNNLLLSLTGSSGGGGGGMALQRCWLTQTDAPGRARCSNMRPVSWLCFFALRFGPFLSLSTLSRLWHTAQISGSEGFLRSFQTEVNPLLRLPEAVGCEVLPALIVQWVRMLSSCRTVVSWLPTAQRLSKERVLFSASNQMLNTHEGTGQGKLIQSIKTNTHTQGWRHRSLDDEILLPYLSGSLV